jgi:hypothetical protein
VTRGVDVVLNVSYKHSRIKEYLKEDRADYPCSDECCTHRDGH